MILCKPRSICLWDFFLEGDGHQAILEFNWSSEQGRIIVDGTQMEVRKHGVFSGHWSLEYEATTLASAQKANAFTRTFEIEDRGDRLVLGAVSAFGRSFCIERSGETVATIAPQHPFTRRATIETRVSSLDFSTTCFAFWLAVLTWRRAAKSAAGNS